MGSTSVVTFGRKQAGGWIASDRGRAKIGICRLLATVVCGSMLVACAGSSSAGGGGGASSSETEVGGLWAQFDRDREVRASRAEGVRESLEAERSAIQALPPGWKERIDRYWDAFRRAPEEIDPGLKDKAVAAADPDRLARAQRTLEIEWLKARAEWEAMGPQAVNLLVENLLRWYFFAYDRGVGYEVARAKEELLRHQVLARSYLLNGLVSGAGDDVLRKRGAELVAWFGPEGIGEIDALLRQSRNSSPAGIQGRWALVLALRSMRQSECLPALSRVARDESEDWIVRVQAIGGLGDLADPRSLETLAALLSDDDPSVAKFAARSFAGYSSLDRSSVEALILALERNANREPEIARTSQAVLSRLFRRNYGLDASAWRRALARGELGDLR